MEIQVERLREVLKLVQPVIPKKPTLEVLKNVLLEDGKLTATNLEAAVIVELLEVDEKCLIPHHAVLGLLKYVPGSETLTIKAKKKSIQLSWADGNASYDVPNAADYPPIPTVKAKAEGAIDGDLLVKALTSMVDYCATEETRPVLNGVAVSFGETVQIAGADGFRLAYQTLPVSFPTHETVIIPAETVRVLEHIWDSSPAPLPQGDSLISQIVGKREMWLTLDNGVFSARFGRITLISQLIQGTYPDYKKLIPEEPPLKVQVFAGELERAVRQLGEIARDSKGAVRLSWDETTMTVAAKSEDKGKSEAKIAVRAEGGPGKTAIQINYLLGYLKGKDGPVGIAITSASSPVLLRYGKSPLVVLMPLFVEW
jgi:DNA polymerase-3 subunit beta